MKSTHHTIRAISLGIGLALLVVSGTAAMIGAFSAPLSTPQSGLYAPVVISPPAGTPAHSGDDSLLYERVARSDGSSQWVLVEEPAGSVAVAANAANGLRAVSYTLQGKSAGLNKVLKNCNSLQANGTKSKANGAYDLSCTALS